SNGSFLTVTGDHNRFIVERIEAFANAFFYLFKGAAGEVGATNGLPEKGITGNQQFVIFKPEAHGTRCVARCMDGDTASDTECLVIFQVMVRVRHFVDALPQKHLCLHVSHVPEWFVRFMQVEWS